jgi:hypothetical protein
LTIFKALRPDGRRPPADVFFIAVNPMFTGPVKKSVGTRGIDC